MRSKFFTELNGLKGLAGIVVIVFHVAGTIKLLKPEHTSSIFNYVIGPLLSGGWFAVDIFFVLSAFFLTYRYVHDRMSTQDWLVKRYSSFFPYIWMGVIPNFCLAILWPDMGLISFLALVIICSVSVNFIKRRNIHSDHAVRMFVIVVALQIIWSIINILDVWANFSINPSFHKINSLLINLLVIQPFSYRGMPVVFWTLFPLLSFYILFILLLKPISNWWKTLPLWGVVLVNLIIGSILLIASIIVKESYFNLRLNQFFRQYSFIVGFQLALYWDEIAKSYTRYQVYILIVSTFVMYLMMLEIYIGIHEIVFMFTSMISAWIAGGIVLSVMHFGLLRKVFSSRLLTIAGSHAYGVFLFQSPILHYANIYVLRNNISTSALLFIVPAATLLMSWVALRVVDFKIK